LAPVEVGKRVEVYFREDAKAGVDVYLEGEGEGDVEEVVPLATGVEAEEHVEGCDFDEGPERAGEGADEAVEDEEFAGERGGPWFGLSRVKCKSISNSNSIVEKKEIDLEIQRQNTQHPHNK